jgi:hypothetical protein
VTRIEPVLGTRVCTIIPLLVPLREPVVPQRRALYNDEQVLRPIVPHSGRFVLHRMTRLGREGVSEPREIATPLRQPVGSSSQDIEAAHHRRGLLHGHRAQIEDVGERGRDRWRKGVLRPRAAQCNTAVAEEAVSLAPLLPPNTRTHWPLLSNSDQDIHYLRHPTKDWPIRLRSLF